MNERQEKKDETMQRKCQICLWQSFEWDWFEATSSKGTKHSVQTSLSPFILLERPVKITEDAREKAIEQFNFLLYSNKLKVKINDQPQFVSLSKTKDFLIWEDPSSDRAPSSYLRELNCLRIRDIKRIIKPKDTANSKVLILLIVKPGSENTFVDMEFQHFRQMGIFFRGIREIMKKLKEENNNETSKTCSG